MTIGRLGERGIIDRIVRRFAENGPTSPRLVVGAGADDAAIYAPGDDHLVVTTDLLVEGVHFRREWTPAAFLGHKALAASLSDLAAMGAAPEMFFLELGLPSAWPAAHLDAFVDGMARLARRAEITLAGGDTVAAAELHIGVTAVGRVAPGEAWRRNTGRPGERLALTRRLGASAAGLELLRRGWRLDGSGEMTLPVGESLSVAGEAAAAVLRRHLAPEVDWNPAVGGLRDTVRAAIDLSDGLARDLRNLCQASGCGACVRAADLPLDPAAAAVFSALGQDALTASLAGGEDYGLLLALPPESSLGKADAGPFAIGSLTAGGDLELVTLEGGTEAWPEPSFEHFGAP